MKLIKTIFSMAVSLALASFCASAQGPMGGGFPGGGMPPMGGFPGFNSSNSDSSSKQDESYQKKLEKILTPEQFQNWQSHQAAKEMRPAGEKPEGQMPEGFDPSKMPEGFDPSKMPEGFDPSKMPEGFGRGQRSETASESSSSSSDQTLSNAEIKERATAKTDRMAKELNLDDSQYKKVLKLNINDMRIRQNSSSQSMGGFPGGMPMGGPMGGGPRF